jgi:hypothetical protein
VERQRESDAPVEVPASAAQRAPEVPEIGRILALQQAAGNRAVATMVLARQSTTQAAPPTTQTTPPPVQRSIVAIMGADRAGDPNQFYSAALRYWRAHMPDAQFITGQRNLSDLMTAIQGAVGPQERLGDLIIVSHANEDGTLSFGLNGSDPDPAHLTFQELRGAVSGGTLPQLGARVDTQTRIRIKGCDIGRSQQMVDLVDEAFGGLGVVTAPTHEQHYDWDRDLADAALRAAEARIRGEVEAAHPEPPPVPDVPPLPRNATRDEIRAHRTAVTEHDEAVRRRNQLMRERAAAIRAETAARHGEAVVAGERAGTVEAFSGPMFQRPGTTLFTVADLRAEVDRLYGHLPEARRAALAAALAAPDRRPAAQQETQRTFQQRGQRIDRRRESITFPDPQTVAEARATSGEALRNDHFTPTSVQSHSTVPGTDGFRVRTVLEGRYNVPGEDARDGTYELSAPWDDAGQQIVVPDDAHLTATARSRVPNPDKFTWSVRQTHSTNGMTTREAVGERVIAYLHHEGLNASAHDWFTRPETDTQFFATSTFTPPPPAATGTSGTPAQAPAATGAGQP